MIPCARVAWTLGLVIVTAGCYEHTFTIGQGAPTSSVVYEEWHNHWLSGLIGERETFPWSLCTPPATRPSTTSTRF